MLLQWSSFNHHAAVILRYSTTVKRCLITSQKSSSTSTAILPPGGNIKSGPVCRPDTATPKSHWQATVSFSISYLQFYRASSSETADHAAAVVINPAASSTVTKPPRSIHGPDPTPRPTTATHKVNWQTAVPFCSLNGHFTQPAAAKLPITTTAKEN